LECQGKIPPQAIDLEEVVLGAILLESKVLDEIAGDLQPELFYKEQHQVICEAVLSLWNGHKPVDILTVFEELKRLEKVEIAGGAYYVNGLTNRVTSTVNTSYHLQIIRQKYMQRELIRLSSDMIRESFDDTSDVIELINRVQDELFKLISKGTSGLRHISDGIKQVLGIIDRNSSGESHITGVPTGFRFFDNFSAGLQPGDLIVIAGETSQGKTALGLNIAVNAGVFYKKRINIYNYEMGEAQISARMMAVASEISSKDMMMGRLRIDDISQIHSRISGLINSQIYIDDCRENSLDYLLNSIRKSKIKDGIDLVIIDYLQLIKGEGRKRNEMIGEIANRLKMEAKTLNIPIILLSQLARAADPTPSIARLKESGDIENAADIVWLLWRPDYYKRDDVEVLGRHFNTEGISVHDIAKGRNIGNTEFILDFNPKLTKFSNFSSDSEPQDDLPF